MTNKYIIVDTREKPKAIQHITGYFDKHGIEYERSKLLFGDYQDYNRPGIVIDRKQNIAELAKNCTVEADRFRREMDRAKKAGARLVILVEQNRFKDRDQWRTVNDIEDLLTWSSPRTQVRGEKVYRVIASWRAKWPIDVIFCDKRSTGPMIIKILYNEVNNG